MDQPCPVLLRDSLTPRVVSKSHLRCGTIPSILPVRPAQPHAYVFSRQRLLQEHLTQEPCAECQAALKLTGLGCVRSRRPMLTRGWTQRAETRGIVGKKVHVFKTSHKTDQHKLIPTKLQNLLVSSTILHHESMNLILRITKSVHQEFLCKANRTCKCLSGKNWM